MKNVLIVIGLFLACVSANSVQAQEFEKIHLVVTTGGDDLRGGNTAFIRLNFLDNIPREEICITNNSGLTGSYGNNGIVSGDVSIGHVENMANLKSITIRHDGNPRHGQPFDTYDNWDIRAIRVSALTDGAGPRGVNIYNSRNDPARRTFVDRLTGEITTVTLFKQ